MFQHFLITRFNLPNKGWQLDKNNNLVQNDEWLHQRIVLFETYCLPSIQNQSCKEFIWLVYFNSDSPEYLLKKISEWKAMCKNFIPQFSSDYDSCLNNEMSEHIHAYISKQSTFIITTRLDNDDALHRDAIQIIQNHFIAEDNVIIDIEEGYCYAPKQGIITKHKFISNQFVSYIEQHKKNYSTVYREGHPAWIGKATFISIKHKRLWLQIVHDTNVVNSLKGKICLQLHVLDNFNLSKAYTVSFYKALRKRFIQMYYNLKHFVKMLFCKNII